MSFNKKSECFDPKLKKVNKYQQAQIQGGRRARLPPPPQKKGGERERKVKKRKGERERERYKKKLSRHNLFFHAYIGLHWPIGVGAGGFRPNKRKWNKRKYVFLCIKRFRISFSVIEFNKEIYILCKGFYYDFSPWKASASGGEAPWPSPTGFAPWTPAFVLTLTIQPRAAPVYRVICLRKKRVKGGTIALWYDRDVTTSSGDVRS